MTYIGTEKRARERIYNMREGVQVIAGGANTGEHGLCTG